MSASATQGGHNKWFLSVSLNLIKTELN